MNISLILTKQCNLRCRYCFESHENVWMSEETALRAIDMAMSDGSGSVGVSFFGGEPLLRKPLIHRCVEYAKGFPDVRFRWNMTTNGLLLDEKFLRFARDNGIRRPYSIINDVVESLKQFRSIALKYGVSKECTGRVETTIIDNLKAWGEWKEETSMPQTTIN